MTQKMFKDKISHAKLKKDEATINMVLIIATWSQNPILVLLGEKELQKTKTVEDWEKYEQLQKTFELVIQQMQASETTLEVTL
jgi:hypothetical protein